MRRRFIGLLAGATALVALTGCMPGDSGKTAGPYQTAAFDVGMIGGGFKLELPVIATLSGMSPATFADVTAWTDKILALSTQLGAVSVTPDQAQALVRLVEEAVNKALVDIAASPNLPPKLALVLNAATTLLLYVEQSVGLPGPSAAPRLAATAKVKMTPDEARAVLKAP